MCVKVVCVHVRSRPLIRISEFHYVTALCNNYSMQCAVTQLYERNDLPGGQAHEYPLPILKHGAPC